MDKTITQTRLCPFCKEEINAEAIKCKHCLSFVPPEKPSHGGTCPYCKEAIHPEAIKCKHCGSIVADSPLFYLSNQPNRSELSSPIIIELPANFPRPAAPSSKFADSPNETCDDCTPYTDVYVGYTIVGYAKDCYTLETVTGNDGQPMDMKTNVHSVSCGPSYMIMNNPVKKNS